MDVVFFGSGAFGLPTLAALAERHQVRAVVTQPDRPAGRGGALTPTPVGAWAAEHLSGVPLLKPQKVNDAAVMRQIRSFESAAWVVIAFGQKLGRELLDGVFAINLHASLLPRWRGAAPINAAVLAGDARTGNSVITLADRMDAGAVLGQSERPIEPLRTAGELHDLLAADGPALVLTVLERHASDALRPRAQDESLVTLAPKLSKTDGWVDFSQSAESCCRRIHGLTPWPGVTVRFRGEPLKLLRVRPVAASGGGPAGGLLDPTQGIVACAPGDALALVEVQPAGKRPMSWIEYARGHRPTAGEILVGHSGDTP
jgi:methionyl-tRNA formyltransferase